MDLNKESVTKQIRPPVLLKKTSSNLKLTSKYAPTRDGGTGAGAAAGTSAAVKMASGGTSHTRTISQSSKSGHSRAVTQQKTAGSQASSRVPTPAQQTVAAKGSGLDIGTYDGGIEIDNEKRGSAVFGEAAQVLALNSSQSE